MPVNISENSCKHLFLRNKSIPPIFCKVIPQCFWVQNFNHFGKIQKFVDKCCFPLWTWLLITSFSRYQFLVCGARLMIYSCLSCSVIDTILHSVFASCHFSIAASCNNYYYNFSKLIFFFRSVIPKA